MKTLQRSILYFLFYTVILGIFYPTIITGIGQVFFNSQANGSVLVNAGKSVGSSLVGQEFKDKKYFWGRPSATSTTPYNPLSSSGTNMSLTNPTLQKNLQERVDYLGQYGSQIPVDLITASGSGLDPEISLASAKFQAQRVALTRGIKIEVVLDLINRLAMKKQLGVIGEPRVNVLLINMELDKL
jgi:K+-transporting ATPase ATPase C chain